MTLSVILTGDINLMNVDDPAVPFRRVADEFRSTDLVFSNMECCLYTPDHGISVDEARISEGFFADPKAGQALKLAGVQAVGIANNVNYGAEPINTSVANLDALGIPHTGAGPNAAAALAPVILERKGLKIGIIQRTAVYWQTNHEATPVTAGVAAIKCHTAYQIPMSKLRLDMQPPNRPGIPPIILTWVDAQYKKAFSEEVAALRAKVDIVIVSLHWGLKSEVLDYMPELAHAAVDAGADIVMGHGPHFSLPVEMYNGKPIYYGLGSFSFHTGHGGVKHGNWVGMLARLKIEGKSIERASFQFVRHNDDNETVLCDLDREQEIFNSLRKRSSADYNTTLTPAGNEVVLKAG